MRLTKFERAVIEALSSPTWHPRDTGELDDLIHQLYGRERAKHPVIRATVSRGLKRMEQKKKLIIRVSRRPGGYTKRVLLSEKGKDLARKMSGATRKC